MRITKCKNSLKSRSPRITRYTALTARQNKSNQPASNLLLFRLVLIANCGAKRAAHAHVYRKSSQFTARRGPRIKSLSARSRRNSPLRELYPPPRARAMQMLNYPQRRAITGLCAWQHAHVPIEHSLTWAKSLRP